MSELESLDVREALGRHLQRHTLDRLIMLSDGVFAIATTLAAIEIKLPEHATTLASVWDQAGLGIIGYFISFFVIAVFWMGNRDLFARLARVDALLTCMTLGMLCVVALIPAATREIWHEGNGLASFRTYALTMAVCGGFNLLMWLYASVRAGVMSPEVSGPDRFVATVKAAFVPLIFIFMLAVPPTRSVTSTAVVVAIFAIGRRLVGPLVVRSVRA